MRDYRLYLDDILKSIKKIARYTKDMEFSQIKDNDLVIDGVVRNLEIIGEAAKNIPAHIKTRYSEIEWKKIAGLRDIIAHEYFGIDLEVLWDIVRNKLPDLKKKLRHTLKEEKNFK